MGNKKILLLSDTHSFFDPSIKRYMDEADEVWHAGDIGSVELYDRLCSLHNNVRAVYGNIDGGEARIILPEYELITHHKLRILLIHIAGSMGRYNSTVRELIKEYRPHVLICGHSHILKVAYDNKNELLYMNPGACGHHGFHKIRTLLKFVLLEDKIADVEAIELGKRGRNG